jgi:hypothetical protein
MTIKPGMCLSLSLFFSAMIPGWAITIGIHVGIVNYSRSLCNQSNLMNALWENLFFCEQIKAILNCGHFSLARCIVLKCDSLAFKLAVSFIGMSVECLE